MGSEHKIVVKFLHTYTATGFITFWRKYFEASHCLIWVTIVLQNHHHLNKRIKFLTSKWSEEEMIDNFSLYVLARCLL
jgi:hypothetical protein